jgi:hypothetical protein
MDYKLDRNFFKMGSQKVSEPAIVYWKTKTPEERLAAAFYLNSVAFNFDLSNPPRLDRTFFSMRKHK